MSNFVVPFCFKVFKMSPLKKFKMHIYTASIHKIYVFFLYIYTHYWVSMNWNISTFCIQETKAKLNHTCTHIHTHTLTHTHTHTYIHTHNQHTLCDLHAKPWHVLTANSPSPETKPDEKQSSLQHWGWFVKMTHAPVLILFDVGYTIRSISFVVRAVLTLRGTSLQFIPPDSDQIHCYCMHLIARKLIAVPVKTKWTSFVQTHKKFKRMLFIRTKTHSANFRGSPLC